MAVVTKYGSGAHDPTATREVLHVYAQGEVRCINSQIAIANGDNATSKYKIGEVPSNAILDPRGYYDYSAVTGVADFDIGFYEADLSAVIDADALVDGDDITAAGTQTLRGHGTLTLANSNKRVWELAGYSVDPGKPIAIVATINADASAAGTVNFTLAYSQ